MLKNSEQIGQVIKQFRLDRNLSQADLAHDLDVTISAVSTWERGISKPGIDVLFQLAQTMNITLDELLTINSNHQTLRDPRAFLEHLDFNDVNVYLTDLGVEGESLKLSFRITGPKLSPKIAEARWMASLNKANATSVDIKPSKQIPAAEEMLNFHAVDVTCLFPYSPYKDAELVLTYHQQSYALTVLGRHIKLIDLGPAIELETMEDFGKLMSSKDYQIAFQFLAQNGHFKKLERNMQSMIEKQLG